MPVAALGWHQRHETEVYQDVWDTFPAYGERSPGEFLAPVFHGLVVESADPTPVKTVLDAGTGSGKGALALSLLGYEVALCDLTPAGLPEGMTDAFPYVTAPLWQDLRPVADAAATHYDARAHDAEDGPNPYHDRQFDYVFCCDVLEHLPEQFTMLAVDQMVRVARRGVFLAVFLMEDHAGHWVGADLHKCVRPYVWWRDALREVGHVLDARDVHGKAVFMVAPR
jgi:SAM-dependent methyltransferase